MDENKLKSIIDAEIANSLGYLETETTEQRREALQSYLRQPYGNEVEGKSQIVTGEVAWSTEVGPSLYEVGIKLDMASWMKISEVLAQ